MSRLNPPLLYIFLSFIGLVSLTQGLAQESLQSGNLEQDNQEGIHKPLVPSALMSDETKWLLGALEKAHFKKLSISELDTALFLERFVTNLDKQKLFFTEQDLIRFKKRYQPTILTYLKQGNLFPAFEMYEEYRKLAVSRLNSVIASLSQAPDLESNETFTLDRSDLSWTSSSHQLNGIWEGLLTHEYINEIFSQIDENESFNTTLELLTKREDKILGNLQKKYKRWVKNILEFEATDVQ